MKLFDLYAELGLDASGFERGVKKASGMGKSLASSLRSGLGGAAGYVGQQVSATTIMMGHLMADAVKASAAAGKQMVSVGVQYNAQMETYQTNFRTMLDGSAEAAQALTAELEDMAAATPFAMTDLADATQTLLAFGQDSSTVMDTLQSLGDIAMGDSQKLQSLTLAFAQASSSGKLMGQDLMQMVNAGFNPLLTISEKTGASMGDLKDFMSDGKASTELRKQMRAAQKEVKLLGDEASDGAKMLVQMSKDGAISADLLGQVFAIETSPGGRFYGAMEAASKTFNGLVSTLEDDSRALLGKVFKPLSDWMTDDLLPKGIDLIGVMDKAFDSGGLAAAVKAGGELISQYFGEWGEYALDAGAGLLANVLSGIMSDTVSADAVKTELEKVWTGATEAVNAFKATAGAVFTGIVNVLSGDSENERALEEDLKAIWTNATTAVDVFVTAGSDIFSGIVAGLAGDTENKNDAEVTIGSVFYNAGLAVSDFVTAGSNVFSGVVAGLAGDSESKNTLEQNLETIWTNAQTAVDGFVAAGSGVFSGIVAGLAGDTEGKNALEENLKTVFSNAGLAVNGFVTTGSNVFSGIVAGLAGDTESQNTLEENLKTVWTNASGVVGEFVSAGSGVLSGILQGLTGDEAGETDIAEAVTGWVGAASETISGFTSAAGGLLGTIYEELSGQEATAENIGKTIGGVFNAGGTAIEELLTTATTFFTTLDKTLGDPDASIGKKIGGVFEAGSVAMISLLNDAGSFMTRLYGTITGDKEGAANIQNWIDRLFATPEEVEAQNAEAGAKDGFDSITELRNHAQTMYGSPSEYGITEAQADEWITVLAQGMAHEKFQSTVEDVLEAWNRRNSSGQESGFVDGDTGGGMRLDAEPTAYNPMEEDTGAFGRVFNAARFGQADFKADEKASQDASEALSALQQAVAMLTEAAAGLPGAAAAAISGAKVEINGQEVGEIILPVIAAGLARQIAPTRYIGGER